MVTVPEATKKIVERSRYLTEALSKGLINLSSLARYIKPEVEEMLIKDVSEASILMALKRLSENLHSPNYKNVFTTPPDMIVRSNLVEIVIGNSDSLIRKHLEILKLAEEEKKYFFTLSQGLLETTIIVSADLKDKILEILNGEKIITQYSNLSAITIRLPEDSVESPGVYYFLLKSLAWEEINIIEAISTYLELNLIFEEKEINRAFTILKGLFNN